MIEFSIEGEKDFGGIVGYHGVGRIHWERFVRPVRSRPDIATKREGWEMGDVRRQSHRFRDGTRVVSKGKEGVPGWERQCSRSGRGLFRGGRVLYRRGRKVFRVRARVVPGWERQCSGSGRGLLRVGRRVVRCRDEGCSGLGELE